MPIFIPIVLIAASTISGGVGIHNTLVSKTRINNALERYKKSREICDHKEQTFKEAREEALPKFRSLYERRLEAVGIMGRAAEFLKMGIITIK